MPPKKKPNRRSEPRLFQCTGYGDCNMVFTRSEHLARHARKHTGEKPFKCTFPDCPRTFSRFDNMIQHTHTHARGGKKNTATDPNKAATTAAPRDPDATVTSPTPSSISQHYPYSPPETFAHATDHGLNEVHIVHPQHSFSSLPESPPFEDKEPTDSFIAPWHYYDVPWHGACEMPTPYSMGLLSRPHDSIHPLHGHLTLHALSHPSYRPARRRSASSDSMASDASSLSPLTPCDKKATQRLSVIDLATPINQLQEMPWQRDSSPWQSSLEELHSADKDMEGVDVTADEYEALQGISKFCTEPVVRHHVMDASYLDQPLHFFSQVPSLRQRLTLVQESFQRPSRTKAS